MHLKKVTFKEIHYQEHIQQHDKKMFDTFKHFWACNKCQEMFHWRVKRIYKYQFFRGSNKIKNNQLRTFQPKR